MRSNLFLLIVYLISTGFSGCGEKSAHDTTPADEYESAENTRRDLPVSPRILVDVSSRDSIIKLWSWEDYSSRIYRIRFAISRNDLDKCKKNRLLTSVSPLVSNAPDYGNLVSHDMPLMKTLAGQLSRKAREYSLNEQETAELVITMIQNIPYTLVHPFSHEIMEKYDQSGNGFIRSYHQKKENLPLNKNPYGGCLDSIDPAGVLSPVEFMSSFKGDCDTRTVCIYSILKAINIPALVINGHGHSMLALAMKPTNPAAPAFIYRGMKYFFLETTIFIKNQNFIGPRIGDVPQGFDPTQWTTVLI